ncbi:MAG: HvfX family Cu-binding RiPP maturation protein [Chitinophagaceae bacterium]
MRNKYLSFSRNLEKFRDFPLLFIRLILAYGFYQPAKLKWSDIHSIGDWFRTLGIPAPLFNAYLSASTEALGVVLLVLGLGTRLISFPLIVTMLVAIKTVHWVNGFEAGNNGYEIPLYYILFLMVLIVFGSGKYSLDQWLGLQPKGNSQESQLK